MRLGASHRPLEIDDDGIMDVIKMMTLPTFSNFYPLFHPVEVVPARDIVQQGNWGKYYVKDDSMKIIGIAKVFRNENAASFRSQYGSNINSLFDFQALNDMMSAVTVPETFSFISPNTVELFPKYYNTSNFLVVGKFVHPDHLATVPFNLRDQFLKLAIADVKIALYPIRKHFGSINSTYGTIELGLELVEGGTDERKDIIDEWSHQYFKEPNRKKIFIY